MHQPLFTLVIRRRGALFALLVAPLEAVAETGMLASAPLFDVLAWLPGLLIASLAVIYGLTERRATRLARRELETLRRSAAAPRLPVPKPVEPSESVVADHAQFQSWLKEAMERSRLDGQPVAVLLLSLNNLPHLTEQLGDAARDHLVHAVTRYLSRSLRTGDRVARWDSERIAILAPRVNHQENVAQLAEKVLTALERSFALGGREIFLKPCLGSSIAPYDAVDGLQLLNNAAAALYQARHNDQGGYRPFLSDLHLQFQQRQRLTADLPHALIREQLELRHQLRYDLRHNRITGVQARVYWRHPELGLLPDADFIPLSGGGDLNLDLSEWLLFKACTQTSRWRQEGLQDGRVIVRLQAAQCIHPDLQDTVTQVLSQTGLGTQDMELEVGPEVFCHRHQETIAGTLGSLASAGIIITFDGAGAQTPTFEQLRRFGVGKLKIHTNLIQNVNQDPYSAGDVKALIELGHNLGLTVEAAGVSTADQLRFLRGCGCDEVLGDYFSRPMSTDDLTRLLRGQRPAVA